ncbi:pyridoxal kinase [Prosthecomicrobium sp. N25]|uniref:pyridoxal kinase n=1 Tax=Prosthecomicrobium sp. N25 TaxID=3129254 RepID=UPI0030771107
MTGPASGKRGDAAAVLVVSSLVARGAVGGRAAVFVLERMGHPVWFLPTVLLPWHPGHGRASRSLPAEADFEALAGDLARAPWLAEVGAVLTGYFATPAQVEAAAALVDAVKGANPAALHLCDPVLGDLRPDGSGGLYVPEPTALAIRDRLVPRADIVTPNRFEAGWLAGLPVSTTAETLAAARALGRRIAVVTSAPAMMARSVAALMVTEARAIQAEHPLVDGAPHGTGDLFAAAFLARVLGGAAPEAALERAAATVFDMVARSVRAGADELLLAPEQDVIAHSMASVSIRTVAEPRRPAPTGGAR